jgi:hypothetical protein
MKTPTKLIAAGVIALGVPLCAGSASAAPLSGALALSQANAAAPSVQTVQWRRGWHGGHWRGGRWIGPAAGLAAGVAIGSALAAPYYYGSDYYAPDYYYEPGAYAAAPVAPSDDDAVAYCEQRFRSYDPASGTYLGYDGIRHPCP